MEGRSESRLGRRHDFNKKNRGALHSYLGDLSGNYCPKYYIYFSMKEDKV